MCLQEKCNFNKVLIISHLTARNLAKIKILGSESAKEEEREREREREREKRERAKMIYQFD